MSHQTIRAGIIGLSWIAADPAGLASDPLLGSAPPYSHASAMEAVGGIEVVAACDLREEARSSFRETWSHNWPNIELFDDAGRLLESDIDLVSIVTPDHMHADLIDQALSAGVPMIFTEKPFTTSLDDADRLLRRMDDAGASVSVNHTWRWRPEVLEARRLAHHGELGSLSLVTIEAGGPRAMLFRNLSHFLDLAIFLAAGVPEWVMAELEPGYADYGTEYAGDGGSDPERDPGAWAVIGFDNGVRAFVGGMKSGPADVSIQVQCVEGRVTIDPLGARVIENPRTGDGTPGSVSGPAIRPLRPRHTQSGMAAGLADLIQSHREGRVPSSSAHGARHTVAVIDAILRSNLSSSREAVKPFPNDG